MTAAPITNFEALTRGGPRVRARTTARRWTELIEREQRVPLELWDELRDRGYLRLAAPRRVRRRAGIPFTRYLELLELFSMSHALAADDRARRQRHLAADGLRTPTTTSVERFVKPLIAGEIKVAFTLTEPDAGSGADIRCSVVREGDTYYLSGEKHLITFGTIADYLLTFARVEGTRGTDGHRRADGADPRRGRRRARDGRDDGRARHRPRPHRVRPRAGAGRRPARRGGPGGGDRAERLPRAEPDLAGDDAASAWHSGRSTWRSSYAKRARRSARRSPSARRSRSSSRRWPRIWRRRGGSSLHAAVDLGGDGHDADGGRDGEAVRASRCSSA